MSEEMKLTASAFEHAVSQQTGRYEFKETKNGAWLFRCDGWLNISIILSNLSSLPSAAHWGKPVAWRVKDYADGWLLCYSEEAAQEQAENGNLIQPLYASPLPTVEVTATHRHKKRGTDYELIGIGKMQAENWRHQPFGQNTTSSFDGPVDEREVAIYRSATDPTELLGPPS